MLNNQLVVGHSKRWSTFSSRLWEGLYSMILYSMTILLNACHTIELTVIRPSLPKLLLWRLPGRDWKLNAQLSTIVQYRPAYGGSGTAFELDFPDAWVLSHVWQSTNGILFSQKPGVLATWIWGAGTLQTREEREGCYRMLLGVTDTQISWFLKEWASKIYGFGR